MKRWNKFVVICLTICMLFALVGCSFHSNMAYTFDVETGDSIKVKMDTSNGWKLTTENGAFYVKDENKETILYGIFIDQEDYDMYMSSLLVAPNVTVLEESEANGYEYTMCEIENAELTEIDYVGWIADSNTGVIIASIQSREVTEEAFERITLTVQ